MLSFDDNNCCIIAEVAQAHDGSLGMAHAYIDAAANAGANAVKFQTHIAAAESTRDEPWRVKFSRQDKTRFDYWKRMEFTEEQWDGLKQHADERGITFLSSPFSLEAAELLSRIGVKAWKVASGEINNLPLLDYMISTKLPMLVSTGMSSLDEIDNIVNRITSRGVNVTLLQCTTAYPCPPEKVGINLLPFYRERYECPVGLSDHSGTIYPGLAAATLGIAAFEVHVAFSKEMFGPDVQASITFEDLKVLSEGVRFIEKMRNNPVDKSSIAQEMLPLRQLFSKSIVARTALPAGTVLNQSHVAFKKPGTGLPSSYLDKLLGRRLRRDVQPDEQLHEDDLK